MYLSVFCLVAITAVRADVKRPQGRAGQGVHQGRFDPGLVCVFFNDTSFQRPASHGMDAGIKNHGEAVEIKSCDVEEQIDMEITGVGDFSKLWLGFIKIPASGHVTFTGEADNGLRLYIGNKCVIDGWSLDGLREGTVHAKGSQRLPLRVDYFQDGGPAFLRLFWEWEGHRRELVPPSAFYHSEDDMKRAKAIAEGKKPATPGDMTPAVTAPKGDEAINATLYRPSSEGTKRGSKPVRLRPGPHLFIDDFLVENSQGIVRRVNCPVRDPAIPNPLITGREDECNGPYMTVLRDPETGRFRIWYNTNKVRFQDGSAHLSFLESEDGIHWIRPHRVLKDPGHFNFGSAVIDEGTSFREKDKRYKLAWWSDGGLQIAVSPDGLEWTRPTPHPVLYHNHDINNIWWDSLRKCYAATVSVYTTGTTWKRQSRATMHTVSKDLINWEKPWYVLTPDDSVEEGHVQFYAMNGYLLRGDLYLGLVKVLRDDLKAPGTPDGAYGIGYTTLAWSRDGKHWVRDTTHFFDPDPKEDAWDHAHAWLDYQLPVGDEVFIYYGGYKFGHKMDRWEGRQIGLLKIKRDRYVSREAGDEEGSLLTPNAILMGTRLTVNARVGGELRVRLLDGKGQSIRGFGYADCRPINGDSLSHPVTWRRSIASLHRRAVQMEFALRKGELYGFDLVK